MKSADRAFSPAGKRLLERFRALRQSEGLSPSAIRAFRSLIYGHFKRHGRDFPWRRRLAPYRVLVSEIMLQQTRTARVAQKYEAFLGRFPDFPSLAAAPLRDVLVAWQGLGYNRRALALKETARQVVERHGGRLPRRRQLLLELPGVGEATAGAVCAFAYNQPEVIIETNIRRVLIRFFFPRKRKIKDGELEVIARRVLDRKEPRKWHYALMDYGAYLGGRVPNPNVRSARYAKQPPFEGSERKLRGMALRALVSGEGMTARALSRMLRVPEERLSPALHRLAGEGFLKKRGRTFRVS